jgi:anti-anti-sigma regulatory factor
MFSTDSEIYAVYSVAEHFTHDEACRLACLAESSSAHTVVLDMARTSGASTAAFARLVLLRRALKQKGRDLQLAGMGGRAAQLFEVHRLQGVLPRLASLPAAAPVTMAIVTAPAKIERACRRRRRAMAI